MKSTSALFNTRRMLFFGMMLWVVLVSFSIQPAEARTWREIAMNEGDPTGGMEGGSGSGTILPPEGSDGASSNDSTRIIQSRGTPHFYSGLFLMFDLYPRFDGQTLVWTFVIVDGPMQGGRN